MYPLHVIDFFLGLYSKIASAMLSHDWRCSGGVRRGRSVLGKMSTLAILDAEAAK
jgi:hypothetical protein